MKKIVVLALCLSLLLVIAACSSGSPSLYKDGTYSGSAFGYNKAEPMEVQVTISKGKITAIELVSFSDTPGFSDGARTQIPARIIEAQKTDVDIFSGATQSSEGIIEAVSKALEKAKN